jgi:hypothetical protein
VSRTEIFAVLQSVKAIWCYDYQIVLLLWNVQDIRLVSSRIGRRTSAGEHCRCRALDDHVEFSPLPKLELLIVTSYLSLFSDGMHEALEIIGA